MTKSSVVDTCLIANVKARLSNSRGVMEDWRVDLKEMGLNVQDRGQRKRERTRGGIAKHHLAVPFSMPWVPYRPPSSKTHTASSSRNRQDSYHLGTWNRREGGGRKEGQFQDLRGLVEKLERPGREGAKDYHSAGWVHQQASWRRSAPRRGKWPSLADQFWRQHEQFVRHCNRHVLDPRSA